MKMKDEEFEKNLELILEKLEKIDLEVKQYLDQNKSNVKNQDYTSKSYSNDTQVLDNKYKEEK
jgi:hypothetical protein